MPTFLSASSYALICLLVCDVMVVRVVRVRFDLQWNVRSSAVRSRGAGGRPDAGSTVAWLGIPTT